MSRGTYFRICYQGSVIIFEQNKYIIFICSHLNFNNYSLNFYTKFIKGEVQPFSENCYLKQLMKS